MDSENSYVRFILTCKMVAHLNTNKNLRGKNKGQICVPKHCFIYIYETYVIKDVQVKVLSS
jgi:hypothetical protein